MKLKVLSLCLCLISFSAIARENIHIVGSSTVFPFAAAVAERFASKFNFPAPVVESTGTGGGFKLFCKGLNEDSPDITTASRQIKTSEIELCNTNGVTEIKEILIGYDGIVLANSKNSYKFDLTLEQIWLALAKDIPDESGILIPNPNKTWQDIDPNLPDIKIIVYGPPPTSGTRDSFIELVMDQGCLTTGDACKMIREDGAYIEAGENDSLLVQKLQQDDEVLGIFGYSFLDQNSDVIQGSHINGVEPNFDTIRDSSYVISRPLFIYYKGQSNIIGLSDFIKEFESEAAIGEDGYLVDKGLVPR